jgi:hypothetical protein
MRILNILSGGLAGGAALASLQMHHDFIDMGHESALFLTRFNFLTFQKNAKDHSLKATLRAKISSYLSRVLVQDGSRKYSFPIRFGNQVKKLVGFDLVIIHFNGDGGINMKELEFLSRNNENIVILLRDFRFLTAGCHYPIGCNEFINSCSHCPYSQYAFDSFFDKSFINIIARLKIRVCSLSPLGDLSKQFPFPISSIGNVVDVNKFCSEINFKTKSGAIVGSINPADAYKGSSRLVELRRKLNSDLLIFGGEAFDGSLGILSQCQIKDELLKRKYFIAPSVQESFNKLVCEAILCGVIPIVFAGSIGPEHIVRSCGFGFVVDSIDEVVAIIDSDEGDYENLENAISFISENFTTAKLLEGIFRLL